MNLENSVEPIWSFWFFSPGKQIEIFWETPTLSWYPPAVYHPIIWNHKGKLYLLVKLAERSKTRTKKISTKPQRNRTKKKRLVCNWIRKSNCKDERDKLIRVVPFPLLSLAACEVTCWCATEGDPSLGLFFFCGAEFIDTKLLNDLEFSRDGLPLPFVMVKYAGLLSL